MAKPVRNWSNSLHNLVTIRKLVCLQAVAVCRKLLQCSVQLPCTPYFPFRRRKGRKRFPSRGKHFSHNPSENNRVHRSPGSSPGSAMASGAIPATICSQCKTLRGDVQCRDRKCHGSALWERVRLSHRARRNAHYGGNEVVTLAEKRSAAGTFVGKALP